MTVILPVGVSASSSWTLVEYATFQQESIPAAGGACQVQFNQLDSNERWIIDHAVSFCDSATPTTLRLYESNISPLSLLDGSASGAFDVADWPAGLMIRPAMFLLAQWTGAAAGSRGTMTLQARVLRRT
jgi:hypothetical protein